MSWWMRQAGELQISGQISEGNKTDEYSEEEVNRAIVYTRQDIILVVSLLSSVNKQLAGTNTRLSWLLIGMFVIICLLWNQH